MPELSLRPRPKPSRYAYDPRVGRYRAPNGRFLSEETIRSALDKAIQSTGRDMRTAIGLYAQRKLRIDQFRAAMREYIKSVHLYNAAMAVGGWGRMTAQDYGRVGAIVAVQYQFLERWVEQLRAGTAPLDGRAYVRAEMYAERGRTTFYAFLDDTMKALGMTEERNVLTPADHCKGCLAASDMGWVPIGELPEIGDRDCLSRCVCHKEYR